MSEDHFCYSCPPCTYHSQSTARVTRSVTVSPNYNACLESSHEQYSNLPMTGTTGKWKGPKPDSSLSIQAKSRCIEGAWSAYEVDSRGKILRDLLLTATCVNAAVRYVIDERQNDCDGYHCITYEYTHPAWNSVTKEWDDRWIRTDVRIEIDNKGCTHG